MEVLMRTLSNLIATVLLLSTALVGCVSTPTVVSYKGAPVNAVNAISMSCSDPYALTQDCSIWTGATLRVNLNDKDVKIAGTADGRIILVMTDRLMPTQYEAEQSADAVQAVAAGVNAKLLKLEGLAAGVNVTGYVLHFDRDVYVALKNKSTLPSIGTEITKIADPQTTSIPPTRPQALSTFSVQFVPAGVDRYPPTDVQDVHSFKAVLHWPGSPDLIRRDEKPARPYKVVGELRFGENWYYESNIKELVNTHVPRVGGDAVLVYHAYQSKSAWMKNPDSGDFNNVYFQSIALEVIRYTDR